MWSWHHFRASLRSHFPIANPCFLGLTVLVDSLFYNLYKANQSPSPPSTHNGDTGRTHPELAEGLCGLSARNDRGEEGA
jgi:hypothetical protein